MSHVSIAVSVESRAAAHALRRPRLSCTYGLVTRRGMPLSPPAAELRALFIGEMSSKVGALHASNA